jgi:hypothetical protein
MELWAGLLILQLALIKWHVFNSYPARQAADPIG